jgi:hypothetical protein
MKKPALVVPHASNRLVVGQNTNFLCRLYRRDALLRPLVRPRCHFCPDVLQVHDCMLAMTNGWNDTSLQFASTMVDAIEPLPEGLTSAAIKARLRFLRTYNACLEKVRKISLNILIWGAGPMGESEAFQKRIEIRRRLIELGHNAMFSEELGQQDPFSQKTLEFAQAQAADLVIILLEDSVGALGETHDFANHPDLIEKIYLLAPNKYKQGYSGVGAIRLLEISHGGVYWYDEEEITACCMTSKAVQIAEARRELQYIHGK